MKRYLYIILFGILALSWSCTREDNLKPAPRLPEPGEGARVPVVISFANPITLHAETRATVGMEMENTPNIKHIHVAVFGWNGYLQDYTRAIPCDASGQPLSEYASQNATTAYFLCYLPINSDGRRTCHIIANGPEAVDFNAYDNDIMQAMTTSDGNGAYWQWIYLENGITAQTWTTVDGVSEYATDANGDYIPTASVVEAFSGIKLIRNFASLTVDEYANNFEIDGWTICNMPTEGSVAIWSDEVSAAEPINHYGWIHDYTDSDVWTYNTKTGILSSTGGITYNGFPLSPKLDPYVPSTVEDFNAAGVSVPSGGTKYIYERAVTADSAPYLLIAARYVASETGKSDYSTELASAPVQYYRMDIMKNDSYVPFYRNIHYRITINSVSVSGYSTPELASRHNLGDNFSISLDTGTITDISDGVTRMYVENSVISLVEPRDTSFWFQFFDVENGVSINDNVEVTCSGTAIASFSVAPSDVGGKRYVSFVPNTPSGTTTLVSTIKLTGQVSDNEGNVLSKLIRSITVSVFNKKSIVPYFSPSVLTPGAGEATTLVVPLPYDLLWTMFPMELKIEDTSRSLNPVSSNTVSIPVVSGESVIDGSSSFYFLRTLNYSEYEELRADAEQSGSEYVNLRIPMVTIKESSATTAYVYNEYFTTDGSGRTTARAVLENDSSTYISPSEQVVKGTSATVSVVSSTGPWTLSIARADGMTAAGVRLSKASGAATDGTSVTVTLPENNSGNAINYLLTLTNTGTGVVRTGKISQAPRVLVTLNFETNTNSDGYSAGGWLSSASYTSTSSPVTLSISRLGDGSTSTYLNVYRGGSYPITVSVDSGYKITGVVFNRSSNNMTLRLSSGARGSLSTGSTGTATDTWTAGSDEVSSVSFYVYRDRNQNPYYRVTSVDVTYEAI